jgi:hypothetical protein
VKVWNLGDRFDVTLTGNKNVTITTPQGPMLAQDSKLLIDATGATLGEACAKVLLALWGGR